MFRVMTKKMMVVMLSMIVLVSFCFSIVIIQSIGNDKKINLEEGQIPLTLYHWDNGGSTETDLVKEVCRKFMEKYPHIVVDVEIISSYEQQFQRFMAAGNVPDVFCVPDGNFGSWVQTGVMMNLQDYYNNTTVIDKENIAQSALQRYRWNGKTMGSGDLYCVPKDITPYVMYYNKDLFDKFKLPYPTDVAYWTNECKELGMYDFVHEGKTITEEEYDEIAKTAVANGILDPYAALTMWIQFGYMQGTVKADESLKLTKRIDKDNHIYGVAKLYPEGLIWSNGADYLNDARNDVLINSKEFIEAYEYIQSAQMTYAAAPTSAVITSTPEKGLFLNGNAACYIEGRTVTVDLRAKADFNWDIAPIPAFTTNQQCNGWSGSVGYAVYSGCKYPDEAYLLAEFFTSKEGQFIMAEAGFTAPLYNDQETLNRFLEIEKGKMPANTEEFIRAAQNQRPGLWQYLPSVKWKETLDIDSGAMFTDEPSMRATPAQFLSDERQRIIDVIKVDFPNLFNGGE